MFVFLFCFYPTGCFLIHLLKYIKRNQEVSAFSGMRSVQPLAVCTYTDICTQEVSAFSGMRSVQPMAVCTYTDICTQEQDYQQF